MISEMQSFYHFDSVASSCGVFWCTELTGSYHRHVHRQRHVVLGCWSCCCCCLLCCCWSVSVVWGRAGVDWLVSLLTGSWDTLPALLLSNTGSFIQRCYHIKDLVFKVKGKMTEAKAAVLCPRDMLRTMPSPRGRIIAFIFCRIQRIQCFSV